MTHKITIALIGEEGVGKTTLVKRHLTGEFERKHHPTDRVDCQRLVYWISEGDSSTAQKIVLEIIDCAGGSLPGREVDACIIMFDVTSRRTFEKVPGYFEKVEARIADRKWKEIPIVLVGNKVDRNDRAVQPLELKPFVSKYQYYDLSAKSNYNFEKPFMYLMRKCLNNNALRFIETPEGSS
jgi:GTP-binding nuclear protein Ran